MSKLILYLFVLISLTASKTKLEVVVNSDAILSLKRSEHGFTIIRPIGFFKRSNICSRNSKANIKDYR